VELGGWGSRNDVLADITAFGRGMRPSTSTGLGKAALALAAPSTSILQMAMSQGLDAAHKALEKELRQTFDAQVAEIQRLADQRVQAAERNALAATELKEAAQAESKLLESKFDQAITGRTELTNKVVAAEARAQELATQVAALTAALAQANERLATAEQGARTLQSQLDEINARREAERREHMLALDRARHGNDQLLATQQADISRLGSLLEKAQDAGEGHAQAARRAEALVATSQAELSAAAAKIGDLQAQIETLSKQADKSAEISAHMDEVLGGLEAIGQTLAGMRGASAESVAKVAAAVTDLGGAVAEIGRKVDGLGKKG
jgi:chromosome segregation ATPase